MPEPLVLREVRGPVGILTLNHESRRNALSRALLEELSRQLARAEVEREVRVVILAANGSVFSSGHDLRELRGRSEEDYRALFALCSQVMETIRRLSKPVIAEVAGLATAAGCQLAATCDLVVASDEARFATPGVKIGLFCSTPAVALVRAVPVKRAMEMLLTGEPIDARAAREAGLVNRVVAATSLRAETLELAERIAAASPYILSLGKRTFYEQLCLDRPEAYALAGAAMVENTLAPDGQEGIAAFLEKRPARWTEA